MMNKCQECNAFIMDNVCATCTEKQSGFKAEHFAELHRFEEDHFWFRSRNRLIVWLLQNYCPNMSAFLEIGCGTGYVLSAIAKAFPDISLHGSEIFEEGLAFAALRESSIKFMQMDAREIPYKENFDCIGIFDVLEHIVEDETVLTQIHHALKTNGIMLITVPQHQWLWSPMDEYSCHVRRYSASDLHKKITHANFEILHSTSFVTTLLPFMMASRFKQKLTGKNTNSEAEFALPALLNSIFEKMLDMEIRMIQMGIRFPVGGSRVVVARKK